MNENSYNEMSVLDDSQYSIPSLIQPIDKLLKKVSDFETNKFKNHGINSVLNETQIDLNKRYSTLQFLAFKKRMNILPKILF